MANSVMLSRASGEPLPAFSGKTPLQTFLGFGLPHISRYQERLTLSLVNPNKFDHWDLDWDWLCVPGFLYRKFIEFHHQGSE
ncbi:Hypothetical predicted protein, partial [Marmota monax]